MTVLDYILSILLFGFVVVPMLGGIWLGIRHERKIYEIYAKEALNNTWRRPRRRV
jgi:hypothetical protein